MNHKYGIRTVDKFLFERLNFISLQNILTNAERSKLILSTQDKLIAGKHNRLIIMATIQEKLAESMAALKAYQDEHGDNLVIRGVNVLGRTHTERLVSSGYLQMVIKGWYIPSSPGSEGDSTVWYVSYWSFVATYLDSKFGDRWCLSPELSLYFHSGKSVIPKQASLTSRHLYHLQSNENHDMV